MSSSLLTAHGARGPTGLDVRSHAEPVAYAAVGVHDVAPDTVEDERRVTIGVPPARPCPAPARPDPPPPSRAQGPCPRGGLGPWGPFQFRQLWSRQSGEGACRVPICFRSNFASVPPQGWGSTLSSETTYCPKARACRPCNKGRRTPGPRRQRKSLAGFGRDALSGLGPREWRGEPQGGTPGGGRDPFLTLSDRTVLKGVKETGPPFLEMSKSFYGASRISTHSLVATLFLQERVPVWR